MPWRRPKVGQRVIHEGVTTSTKYDRGVMISHTEEAYREEGMLLEIERSDDRCTIQYDDGSTCDNIHIRRLRVA